jgi:cobalt-zinc-cadmium efflux system membrane fusion protein
MKVDDSNPSHHAFRSRRKFPPCFLSAALTLVVGVMLLPGCNNKDGGTAAPEAKKEEKKDEKHADEVKLTAEAVLKNGITVEPVKKRMLVPTFLAPARVSFNTEAMAHVGAAVRGRVVDMKVRKGDLVKKGDTLLIVESPELGEAQSDFLQKRTTADIAGPAVELAKNTYDRAKELYEKEKGIALTEVQKRESDFKVAQGALRSSQSALSASENKLHLMGMDQKAVDELAKSSEIKPRYAVTAPIDGHVTEREVTLGELVSPDKEALLVMADMSTLWVLADVPEARLGEVAVGSRTRIKLGVGTGEAIEGTVSYIDHSLDANTRSARLRIEVKNATSLLRPGMFAQAEIFAATPGEKAQAVLAIPDDAVQTVEGGPAVFTPVPKEENTFAKRPVTVGKPTGGWVAVLSGLKEGDLVVIKGSFILKADLGKGATEE